MNNSIFYDWCRKKYDWKLPFIRIWFAPVRFIRNYNIKECKNFYPDWNNGKGTKVKPFFGYVLIISEGEAFSWNWWKYLHRVKSKI